MITDRSVEAFFLLVRAGLFPVNSEGGMVHGSFPENVDWSNVYRLAEEQSVVGLVSAGIENLIFKVPQEWVLQFVGQTLQIEQRNKAMNAFINELLEGLSKNEIYALIVKGQGVAQCYEKPLWRASGDIDFYLNEDDFQKAKKFFRPLVDKFDPDDDFPANVNFRITA